MVTKKNALPENIQAQILGLTDSHIDYFAQDLQQPQNKVGIHHQMLPAFQQLATKALSIGISIKIASGFRSFERQLVIWNDKFTGKRAIKNQQGTVIVIEPLSELELSKAILLYSALPGASRHHWGCDIDVYADNLLPNGQSLQLEHWEYAQTGPMAKLSTFLKQEAHALGFYFPYDAYRGGVANEPWHLSYAPLAKIYQQHIKTELLAQHLSAVEIMGKNTIIDNIEAIAKQFIFNTSQIPTSRTIGNLHG
ncbi:MAG: M15 family metallopeptidase [Litorilituus sp.]|jgi:LAS superfamily LD-carboxypeptidase LdcB|nr:M15 family metallopeptidase [Litorilituus sp.]